MSHLHCRGCGRTLATGEVISGADGPACGGFTFEPVIIQPAGAGHLVYCVPCYAAEGIAARFPNVAAVAAAKVADFPERPAEPISMARARLARHPAKELLE